MLEKFHDLVSVLLAEGGLAGSIEPGERSVGLSMEGLPVFIGLAGTDEDIVIQCPVSQLHATRYYDRVCRQLLRTNAMIDRCHGCSFALTVDDIVMVNLHLPIADISKESFLKKFSEFQETILAVLTGIDAFMEKVRADSDTTEEICLDHYMLRV